MAKEILINQLFAGRYLNEGENIGHEVINLFKDDDGNNNLFITPSGSVNEEKHNIEFIIFVRHVSKHTTVEVVGMAKDIYTITNDEMHQIRYAGVSLDQIFNNNTYHGGKDIFANHVTFRAKKVRLPKKRIFITIDNNYSSDEFVIYLQSKKKVIIPQGVRSYYSSENDETAYSQLKRLAENNDLWEPENTTRELIPDGAVYNKAPTFLEVVGKEDDEIIFSNLIGYFFEYSHTNFQKFASESTLFNIPNISASFELIREKKVAKKQDRIDLWIESDKDIIVIENKIKSGINGVTDEDYSQLNSYYEYAEYEAKKSGKKTHYYVFAPDYSRLDLKPFGLENKYTIIKYSDIYNFFIKETAVYIADKVFPEFVIGLKRHTLSLPELQFDIMRSRLLKKINQLQ